uniref:Polyamine oxidase n=1 Tax=Nephromyces sp. MMRI TaxID=2496275 RepID=A0A3S8V397_9APIC|nr:polyamine oxidase [Nephromyces sp. MMRI]
MIFMIIWLASNSAARRLYDIGIPVTVFEARKRVGGRALSVRTHEVSGIDLGSTWIHGIEDNPIFEICEEFDLKVVADTHGQDKSEVLYDMDGTPIDSELDSVGLMTHQKHQTEVEQSARLFSDAQAVYMSFGKCMDAKLKEATESDPKKRRILNWHMANIEYSTGADASHLCLPTWDQDDLTALQGAHVMIDEGYQRVVEFQAQNLDIRLGCVIHSISYTEQGVNLQFLGDERSYHFDYCIVTVPLGVLKASVKQFCTLPHVNHVNYHEENKVPYNMNSDIHSEPVEMQWEKILNIAPQTWLHQTFSDTAEVDETEKIRAENNATSTPFGCIRFDPPLPEWKAVAIDRMGFGLINKVVFVFPKIFWDTKKRQLGWASPVRGMFSQAILLHPKPVIIFLLSGTICIQLEKKLKAEVAQSAFKVLQLIFKNEDIPQPVATYVTQWNSDPFSRGSYSYLPPGMVGRDYDILSYPVQDRLLFAGEHTMRPYPSTTHGACLSGRREADRIIDWVAGKLEKEKVQKWFHGSEGDWYSVDLNDIDCQAIYHEDIMEGPTLREREGWFSFIKCALCGMSQTLDRPFCGCAKFKDSLGHYRRWAVHEDCCYYSPEVCSNNEGSRWYNICKAVRRGATQNCALCNNLGATIGCSFSKCNKNFHLTCARSHLDWPNYSRQGTSSPLFCIEHRSILLLKNKNNFVSPPELSQSNENGYSKAQNDVNANKVCPTCGSNKQFDPINNAQMALEALLSYTQKNPEWLQPLLPACDDESFTNHENDNNENETKSLSPQSRLRSSLIKLLVRAEQKAAHEDPHDN